MVGDYHKIDDSKNDEAASWKIRGNSLYKQGVYDSAISFYNSGLEIDPYNTDILHNKSMALKKLGKNEEAQKILELITSLKSNSQVETKSVTTKKEKLPRFELKDQISFQGLFETFKETFSNAPEWKGYRFEKYVLNLFNPNQFSIVEMTHKFTKSKDMYVESDMNPDFLLRHKETNQKFAVEAKYRANLNENRMLECSKPTQLKRYRNYARFRKIPVYFVIGYGGVSDNPDKIFLIPLKDMKYPSLYPSVFNQFVRDPRRQFIWDKGMLY